MELLPTAVRAQLPPLYSQENNPDPLVVAAFYHPLSSWKWFATEGSPVDDNGIMLAEGADPATAEDYLFFGYVHSPNSELGYFSLTEMESVIVNGLGMERDLHFPAMRLSEVRERWP